jgi:hypothetical protein
MKTSTAKVKRLNERLADRVKSARTNSSVYGFREVCQGAGAAAHRGFSQSHARRASAVDRVGTWARRSNVVSRSEAIRLLIEKGLEK